ncbi:MAG TPA: hypothetical protein VFV46_08175 [Lacibacter sp.]|nr:hypothetical protein [Lacibacter sp.]
MRKSILLLLTLSTMAVFAQPPAPAKTLSNVNTVRPKKGQKMAFEAAWKAHVAKFHKEEKVNVYEILTGAHAGSYHIVSSGRSYADFDNPRSDASAHSIDLDKNFFPYLEETMSSTYRFIDSLSWQPQTAAESFVVAVDHFKQGFNQSDWRREQARGLKIQKQMANPMMMNFSWSVWEQLWDGSDQVVVNIQNRKDGFKSLEPGFYGPPTPPVAGAPTFRDRYTKEYGYDAWDARTKLYDGAIVKTEQYLMRLRKDLSSQ